MYCVKCKAKTNTTNKKPKTAKNGKPYYEGKCVKCKSTKTKFMSKQEYEKEKKGGFVLTIPAIAAAAGALSSLAGGAAGIANAVNKKKHNDKLLKEKIRHNKAMEKKGKGLFRKPYKK